MIKFAVLNIRDIISRLILILVSCAIFYCICNILANTFNNVEVYKRYITYTIPIHNIKNDNTFEHFMKYMLSNEMFFLKKDIKVMANVDKIPVDNNINSDNKNNNEEQHNNIPIGVTNLTIKDINNKEYQYINNVDKVNIKNKTTFNIDYNKLVNSKLNLFKQNKLPTILIIHTHSSETYTGVEHTDYFRNENTDINIVRVGEELANILTNSGYEVIHDKRLYDYPTYSGSYTRALSSIQEYIQQNSNVQIVLDIHRDALASNENFAPSAKIDGNEVSQIAIISGTSQGGLEHPNWEENLKLALQLYNTAYQIYPNIFRPLTVTQSRYNQHVTNGSLILEVGATGNTLEQSILSMRYFAKILDVTLKNM